MYPLISHVLMWIYIVLPVALAGSAAVRAWRSRGGRPLLGAAGVALAGMGIAGAVVFIYAWTTGGRIVTSQILLAGYFATAMLVLLRGFNHLLRWGLARLLRFDPGEAPSGNRSQLAFLLRAAVLFAVGLPYVMAVVMVYRPKAAPRDDPMRQLGRSFEPVRFAAADGVMLAGWWIPAAAPTPSAEDEAGRRTVIICHGLGADKSNHLILAHWFVPHGFNVLIFDFRAHGQSAGQRTTFGDLERRDVLGAVRWLRAHHPDSSEQIFGVGVSMGAAALVAAAADPAPEGQAIDAVVVYAGYDAMRPLARAMADEHFPRPLSWLAFHLGLPIAGLHAGTNLAEFIPADEIAGLWPRPVLVIHGRRDEMIPFDFGRRLFHAATQPKQRLWLWRDHNTLILDDDAGQTTRHFLQTARPTPVI